MFTRTFAALAAGILIVVGTGCACCWGIAGHGWPKGVSPISASPCSCEELSCTQCSLCTGCSPASTCGCQIPTWGPLSPLFAILCWGYPDNGCGELYLGDWPTQPRGCQPCDHFGNWVGRFGSGEITQNFNDPTLVSNPILTSDLAGIPRERCSACDHPSPPQNRGYQDTPPTLSRSQSSSPPMGQPHFRKVSSAGYTLKTPGSNPQGNGFPRTELVPCPQCGRSHITRPIIRAN